MFCRLPRQSVFLCTTVLQRMKELILTQDGEVHVYCCPFHIKVNFKFFFLMKIEKNLYAGCLAA